MTFYLQYGRLYRSGAQKRVEIFVKIANTDTPYLASLNRAFHIFPRAENLQTVDVKAKGPYNLH